MIVVVMGVCGSGKTTVGTLIAERLGACFAEGDRYHPKENIEKMSKGIPLDDDDRRPWLESIAAAIDRWRAAGEDAVIACSALKESYRRVIVGDRRGVHLVYLRGSAAQIADRMARRHHHFMPPTLLPSQFAALEEPQAADSVIVADVSSSPDEIADLVVERIAPRSV
ncbi:MAG: gluconokinase [Alphaproteobacteria bacterium]